jgi:hypothetical protein
MRYSFLLVLAAALCLLFGCSSEERFAFEEPMPDRGAADAAISRASGLSWMDALDRLSDQGLTDMYGLARYKNGCWVGQTRVHGWWLTTIFVDRAGTAHMTFPPMECELPL